MHPAGQGHPPCHPLRRHARTVHPARGWLVEATASRAAIHAHLNKIIPGPEVRNHGWLEIAPDEVRVRLLSFNRVVTEKPYLRTTGGDLLVA